MASDTVSKTSDDGDLALKWSGRWSLAHRILAVNILTIALVATSILYLDAFRNQLSAERMRQAEREVTMAARGLQLLGDKERPNGFQLYVKDKNWKAKYGPWYDVQEGQWAQVTFPVGAAEADFDPSQVNAIGLKMAAGEKSSAKFQGSIYVDAVTW